MRYYKHKQQQQHLKRMPRHQTKQYSNIQAYANSVIKIGKMGNYSKKKCLSRRRHRAQTAQKKALIVFL